MSTALRLGPRDHGRRMSCDEFMAGDYVREDAEQPKLKVYRRRPDAWEILDFASDSVYRTDLLPGFELPVTPPAE